MNCENKALVEVTKEFTFDAAHHLEGYYGVCSKIHGHTYRLQVTLKGLLNKVGIVFDFKDLKELVHRKILSRLDHSYLNDELSYNPTAENMVVDIYEIIHKEIFSKGVTVVSVKLWETPTSFVEYKGVEY